MEIAASCILSLLIGGIVGGLWSRKITAQEIWQVAHNDFIRKSEVDEYFKWMSRDFPVFQDAHCFLFWLDDCLDEHQHRETISQHREAIKKKYIDK